MIPPPASRRVFLAGISGAGKSTAAWRIWLAPVPRRLIIDYTGEWGRHADVTTYTPGSTVDAIRRLAPAGHWTIAAAVDPEDDLPELIDWMIPLPDLSRSPIRALGGITMLIDEIDVAAPPGSMRKHIRTGWRRGRHVGLSIVAATQRPEAVSREVSSQSQDVLAMMIVERAAFEYLKSVAQIEPAALRAWTAKHPHGGLYLNRTTGQRAALTEQGQWVRAPELPGALPLPTPLPVAPLPAASSPDASEELEELEELEPPEPGVAP